MSSLQAVTNEDFEQSVIQADTPVLVDFYAEQMDWVAGSGGLNFQVFGYEAGRRPSIG